MSRDCLAATKLVKSGRWTINDMKGWLNAVINQDAAYVEHAKKEIAEHLQNHE